MDDALAQAAAISERALLAGTADGHDLMTVALARAHSGAMADASEPGRSEANVWMVSISMLSGNTLSEAVSMPLSCGAAL